MNFAACVISLNEEAKPFRCTFFAVNIIRFAAVGHQIKSFVEKDISRDPSNEKVFHSPFQPKRSFDIAPYFIVKTFSTINVSQFHVSIESFHFIGAILWHLFKR